MLPSRNIYSAFVALFVAIQLVTSISSVITSTSVTTKQGDVPGTVTNMQTISTGPPSNENVTSTTPAHPTLTQAILYGLLATTLTNLAAITGFVFTPLHKCSFYPNLISFMVATAVGSLFSTSVLVLIPEALMLTTQSVYADPRWYLKPGVAVCAGSMLFFLFEFFLRCMRSVLERVSRNPDVAYRNSLKQRPPNNHIMVNDPSLCDNLQQGDVENHVDGPGPLSNDKRISNNNHEPDALSIGESVQSNRVTVTCCADHLCARLIRLDPIVWMIVIGDGMHNFMDGLSLGAAFSMNLHLGMSLTLAVLCEEIPHELGDFGILLRSGLSAPMAVTFNILSACSSYFGFFIGVLVGNFPDSTVYIFAVTAGFFVYIALADMLPEMRRSEEARLAKRQNVYWLFLIHSTGLLFGFGCILGITVASDYIQF